MESETGSSIWAETGSYPPRTDNNLQIFIDGQEAFAAIYDAIAAASSYVYATFAYVDFDFRMRPELPVALLELLKSRAAAGVDVRILIWDPVTKIPGTIPDPGRTAIPGINQGSRTVEARWDQPALGGLYLFGCHHQKTFMIDGKTAFVGGINSTQAYWDTHAHDPLDIRRVPFSVPREQAPSEVNQFPPLHDLFTRLEGPCLQDVEANFIERWNGATFVHEPYANDLAPHSAPEAAGPLTLQITRTIANGQYAATPNGERSILESYLSAIDAARGFIYFENQYFYDHGIQAAMERALDRGVQVIGLMARRPDQGQLQGTVEQIREWLGNESLKWRRKLLRSRVELFCPVIARLDPNHPGRYLFEDIYVHAKALIVDDCFFTIGSANISTFSMKFNSELNVVANDAALARALRKQLWKEHLQRDNISDEDFANARDGFDLWRQAARDDIAAYQAHAHPPSRVFPWDFDFD